MSDADTMEEFSKSYSDSIFGIRMKEGVFPCFIAPRSEVGKGSIPLIYYTGPGKGEQRSHDLNWVAERDTLVREFPFLGCFKVGPTVGYLRVNPLKQYKKGYFTSNVEVFCPNTSEVRKVFPRFVPSSGLKEVVWQVYRREFFHPLRAVELIEEGEGVGYPLSSNFGLYIRADSPNPIILHKSRDAGVYKKGVFELFKPYELLKEQFARETKVECKVCQS